MNGTDQIFQTHPNPLRPFEFNEQVACVFDDMAQRSIPFYHIIQQMTVDLAVRFFQPGSSIYDLGYSTGTTILLLLKKLEHQGIEFFKILGLDTSEAMKKQAEQKLNQFSYPHKSSVTLLLQDIRQNDYKHASVIIALYTLQFIEPKDRISLLKQIYKGLEPGGVFLMSEKLTQQDPLIRDAFVQHYYQLKRQHGYSELEISQKREALEQVLIPLTSDQYMGLFREAGFDSVYPYFSWYNFTSFICHKSKDSSK
jgi:tRNA (cmo5U34)-methyltransferase